MQKATQVYNDVKTAAKTARRILNPSPTNQAREGGKTKEIPGTCGIMMRIGSGVIK
uniref:Uncharacterized protein n=1 Tax=Candidatus Kentrum sp. LPFa TaxID=2126335 RepID=A0A450XB93_9GAMM|nr:MAG: hypothetical protein BECKLPF1236A_GA0070988_1003721 [Candidatus Kentron sp. LPFa]VFK26553.1 MAG: hypothetical protein BECKLPF1236C_GA0070990_1003620 [Candidatus Kentron sp. LPFa]